VADDNIDAAGSLALRLELAGHEVRTAQDGREALAVARAFEPQVVLLDLGMPSMDGYETARHLRRLAWGKDARLIALTGWGQQQDRLRTAEAGFDLHLVKPVSEADLFKAIGASESAPARSGT
jgi:CheY-like chemotaxis protein